MVRCVTDLGLRCAEVVKLRLDDLDWSNGIMRIARTKTHFTDSLPLLAATGDAIADYLRHERSKTSNRAIFVRHVAPYDVPTKAGAAKPAGTEAFVQTGLDPTHSYADRKSGVQRKGMSVSE